MIENVMNTIGQMGGGLVFLVLLLLISVCIVAFIRLKAPQERKDPSNPAGES